MTQAPEQVPRLHTASRVREIRPKAEFGWIGWARACVKRKRPRPSPVARVRRPL